ncbi:dTDP-4-dehydrorhamnose 3,5-epimerase [Aeromonas schubertii]|uniref:dTDP-4-dehydrorhamnose 3,5-epimerase n=1 Tax=Aeromonas schubertii TaxID=652 RepID=UPI0010A881DA|nr:dTDP-4-dehydrorhamnose 3,5-epimerase [Aeromonas schubertii]QCG47899.1 dTDP-4-dehydrorhamnose 3,5-epimerase [Aeromonas schubertii]
MHHEPLAIPDVVLIHHSPYTDTRGIFFEAHRQSFFSSCCANVEFVQQNVSHSKQGVLRGLHYQVVRPQGKLIHVLAGCVFDVVVDLRPDSASFGRWVGTRLSATRPSSLWIPPGFAHGFYVTSESATLFYQCTDYYCSEYDRAIHWADPTLAIDWPLVENVPPLLSDKDNQAPFFDFSLNKQS